MLRGAVVFGALLLTVVFANNPGVENCTLHWITQPIDHFGWENATFQERYFVYDKWFVKGGPVLFYTGNEANVELFVENTGWMWTQGEHFGALLVFAEHRAFGDSVMCRGGIDECGDHLSSFQAMGDFANLIRYIHNVQYPTAKGTITIGGSYGGMLAAWMRMWYPALVNGAVASSAPIACISSDYNTSSYWKVVSRDATPAGGSDAGCFNEVHNSFEIVIQLSSTETGRQRLQSALRLCNPLTHNDTEPLTQWLQGAFDLMAMGDYPFPTSYIAGTPKHPPPAWPMKVACSQMRRKRDGTLTNFLEAINVVRNTSKELQCHDIHKKLAPSWRTWDFMVCTEAAIHEQPFFSAAGPPNDMFFPQKVYDHHAMDTYCEAHFKKTPRWGTLNAALGPKAVNSSSNIVFANGLLDPWHSGGILYNRTDRDIVALIIEDGGHHLDLFFPTPNDPQDVLWVRQKQIELVEKWLK